MHLLTKISSFYAKFNMVFKKSMICSQNEQILWTLILLFNSKFYCFLVLHKYRNDSICLVKSLQQEVFIWPGAQQDAQLKWAWDPTFIIPIKKRNRQENYLSGVWRWQQARLLLSWARGTRIVSQGPFLQRRGVPHVLEAYSADEKELGVLGTLLQNRSTKQVHPS